MATWHKAADPLLNSDIPALAAAVSGHTHTCRRGEDLGGAMAAAVAASRQGSRAAAHGAGGGAVGSRVSTLIVPHDLSWEQSQALPAACTPAAQPPTPGLPPGAEQFVRDAAAALTACPRGAAALYIGGRAALADGAGGKLRAVARFPWATLLFRNCYNLNMTWRS
jgi:acetolactate synthase-1/2/3 large subunit